MELIGKGGFEKGTLHVALRVPDGHIAAHANQARITSFLPCDDPSTCNAAPDVVSFAIKYARRAHPNSTQHTYSRRHVFTPQQWTVHTPTWTVHAPTCGLFARARQRAAGGATGRAL